MKKRVAAIVACMFVALAATFVAVPTTDRDWSEEAGWATARFSGFSPMWWAGGQIARGGGVQVDIDWNGGPGRVYERRLCWPVLLAEQFPILLVALGAIVFLVRRDRRRRADTASV